MLTYLNTLARRSWRMFVVVAKVMLPVMIAVHIAEQLGWVVIAGRIIAPVMALLNLPPEAGIIWATTVLTGIYGGIASLSSLTATLELNSAQLSALCAMMLFSHAIPVEQSVVRRAGASFGATATLRLITAVAYGGAVAWFCALTGTLSEPVSLDWLHGSAAVTNNSPADTLDWLKATAFSLALTLGIIAGLVLILDAMEKLGITRRITALMMPVLHVSGLDARVAPVTTVGVLLGLTYGGALIIDEAKKHELSPRSRFLALAWLSLSHALIEDTLLIVALGANIWIVLVGRVLITLLIVAALARLTNRGSWREPELGAQQA
jgi:hypothetical protein